MSNKTKAKATKEVVEDIEENVANPEATEGETAAPAMTPEQVQELVAQAVATAVGVERANAEAHIREQERLLQEERERLESASIIRKDHNTFMENMSKEPLVEFEIPLYLSGDLGSEYELSLNGKTLRLKPGVKVLLPKPVADYFTNYKLPLIVQHGLSVNQTFTI